MSFDVIAYGTPPSLHEYLHAEAAPESELPELPPNCKPRGWGSFMPEAMRRRRLLARKLALKAEQIEAEALGVCAEAVLAKSAPQYQLSRIVKRSDKGWHLLINYQPNGSIEGFRDIHLDEAALGGKDSDRTRLDRLPGEFLSASILQSLEQQNTMRTAS